MENNENLTKLSQADLKSKKAKELVDKLKELDAGFKSIADKNVMVLTSAYTHNFNNVAPEVLIKQLEILKSRSDELQKLALDYHFACGREYEPAFYKVAVVTGNLARARLIGILEDMEGVE